MKLSDRKWEDFFIAGEVGIFNIKSTSSGIDKNKLIINEDNNKIPYITRSNFYNGINVFISEKQDNKYLINEGNVITIGLDTQTVFYQPYKFYTGQNIQILSHPVLNKNISMFLIPLIQIQMKKFNWGGYGATLGRLIKTKIMLPVKRDDESKPDWAFMEAYIKEKYARKENKYLEYVKEIINELKYKEIAPLSEKEWKEFKLQRICYIYSGKDIYESERNIGNIPYITSTSINNGIKYFVSNYNETIESEAISVNRNGSVGYAFYHKYEALYSNDCRKLKLKEINNDFTSLFVTNQIMQQKNKYNYGYKMGTARLKKQNILLPIDDNGKPDYVYMEQYIKNLMLKKYKQYKSFKEKAGNGKDN